MKNWILVWRLSAKLDGKGIYGGSYYTNILSHRRISLSHSVPPDKLITPTIFANFLLFTCKKCAKIVGVISLSGGTLCDKLIRRCDKRFINM